MGDGGGRTILRDFTWTRVGEKLEAVYRNLLVRSGRTPSVAAPIPVVRNAG